MGRYQYSDEEKRRNKALLHNQHLSAEVIQSQDAVNDSLDDRIKESEALLASLGIDPAQAIDTHITEPVHLTPAVAADWSKVVAEAEHAIPEDVYLEDILSAEEFGLAYQDLDRIEKEFGKKTGLTKPDIAFLITATAIQAVRSALFGALSDHLSSLGDRIKDTEGDELVKAKKKAYTEKHKDWEAKKENQGRRLREEEGMTWKEIVFSGVPYDVISGSKDIEGVTLSGNTHRYETLGHDPVLGWFFGTVNILTRTLTVHHPFSSYEVKSGKIQPGAIPYITVFSEAVDRVQSDKHLLPAAVFRQALHYQSDFYTKKGLPLPVLETFAPDLASKLYKEGYDSLAALQDNHANLSAVSSQLINMLIALIHGLLYLPSDAAKDDQDLMTKERDLFEVRTRKIILLSNTLATGTNLVYSAILKKMSHLDLGGLIVTISHLFSDGRFIAKVEEDYIQAELDAALSQELMHLDELWDQIQNS